jgi:4'-phosphopantetheinyl transferase
MALNFNISHTAGRVACVISGAGQIGLDVERIRSNMDVEELARGHFSQAENAAIAARAPAERRKAFYELWVLKEAYVKACGKGLSIPLDAFSIIRDGADIAVRPEPDSSYSRQQWRFWLGMFEDDLPVAVAASDQGAFDLMPVLRDATPLLLGLPAGPSPDGGWPQSTGSPIEVSRSS